MANGSNLPLEDELISPDDHETLLASAIRHGIFRPCSLAGDNVSDPDHPGSPASADLDLSIYGYHLPPTPPDGFNPFPDAIDLYGFETDDASPSPSLLENQEPDPIQLILEDQEERDDDFFPAPLPINWEGFDSDPGEPIADDFGLPLCWEYHQFEDEEVMGAAAADDDDDDDELPLNEEVMAAAAAELPWDRVEQGIICLMFNAASQVPIGDALEDEEMDTDADLGLLETDAFVRFFAGVGEVVLDSGLQFEPLDTYQMPLLGNPPAARSVVEGLPFIVLTAADVARNGNLCAVCKDEISLEERVRQLPCLHHYHGDCIVPWLAIRNTCPVCRFELPTEDSEYERFD